ncbi:2-C-methyl-D-erythritol 4-phosphate cytidylyltransferase [Clostridium bowmanii]|uniref:2-C-methyl-D-erythritol 4-phosphate cytidylyltransferase n=1 Tax=Clostridium bowmanii TaxID=132925 RepID=UPI001C0E5176|nr:2-C-methyl-D-erythritol 4-phosphate cytidylyltransferase [Clostridium bowmanii]MBU3188441.1 2-C-methyl-D-erythritol 4-phosphate cytidylyltransferase [Clostridium bowmanii]MCA1072830.1 2-C-methyl-D-erythritol 4-phosphate cytidylyltransferase [Clostridium bowmanii]
MNIAIILAGGKGSRMGMVDEPKQFIDIYGKPIVVHTIEAFDIHEQIDAIAVVCLKEWHEDIKIWTRKYELNKVKWIVDGGETRQESVFNGLKAIEEDVSPEDIVVIHDSARPLISHRIIVNNIEGAKKYGAVDTVIKASDTIIKSTDDETISSIPVRKELYIGQTPQSFVYSTIYDAHKTAEASKLQDSTDDCRLVLNCGKKVHLVDGDKLNFKITTMEDLLLLKSIVKMSKLERI